MGGISVANCESEIESVKFGIQTLRRSLGPRRKRRRDVSGESWDLYGDTMRYYLFP